LTPRHSRPRIVSRGARFIVGIETKGQPSRWITLRALQVLKT
jgi:hypothetical protein